MRWRAVFSADGRSLIKLAPHPLIRQQPPTLSPPLTPELSPPQLSPGSRTTPSPSPPHLSPAVSPDHVHREDLDESSLSELEDLLPNLVPEQPVENAPDDIPNLEYLETPPPSLDPPETIELMVQVMKTKVTALQWKADEAGGGVRRRLEKIREELEDVEKEINSSYTSQVTQQQREPEFIDLTEDDLPDETCEQCPQLGISATPAIPATRTISAPKSRAQVPPIAKTKKQRHGPKCTTNNTFTCQCGLTLPSNSGLLRHIRYFSGNRVDSRFKCSQCGKPCASNADLRRHVVNHHDNQVAACRPCGMIFMVRESYEAHLQSVHGSRSS